MTKADSIEKKELWPSIVSVIVPLIQLLSVVIIGLSETFHIAKLLVFPDFLNLVNLLTLLVIVASISWFWYWRGNINFIVPFIDEKTKKHKPNQLVVEKINRLLIIASIFVLLLFIFVSIAGYQNLGNHSIVWGTLQYISYSLLLVLTGLSIYIWIFEFIQKKQTFRREDFVKNLINALEEQGLIKRPNFKILKNEMNMMARIVEIEIDNQKLFLNVSFDGLEINKVQTKAEFEKMIPPKNAEQLKAEIAVLSEQLKQLNEQLNSGNKSQPQ